jgi:hypothetical protein
VPKGYKQVTLDEMLQGLGGGGPPGGEHPKHGHGHGHHGHH